jgi:hypothetical protein
MFPKIENKFVMTNKVRNDGANDHLPAYIVLINGSDNTITAKVAGTKRRAVYLTEEAKTVLRSCGSLFASSLEKVGNKTVDIGRVKKVNKIAKFVAIL